MDYDMVVIDANKLLQKTVQHELSHSQFESCDPELIVGMLLREELALGLLHHLLDFPKQFPNAAQVPSLEVAVLQPHFAVAVLLLRQFVSSDMKE